MMIFFGLYFPSYALNATSSQGGVIAASLCCPVAFGLGMDNLAQFENGEVLVPLCCCTVVLLHCCTVVPGF